LAWCSLHGAGIFEEEERRVAENVRYPKEPFPAEILQTVVLLPIGFQKLARIGKLSLEMLILLGRITSFEKLNKTNKSLLNKVLLEGTGNNSRTFNTFNEACPALSLPEPSLEKYLSNALLLYCGVTFSPKRSLLEACNLIFSIPRVVLVRELPSFDAGALEEEHRCLLWIWLVMISSLIIANKKRSTLGTDLTMLFVTRNPVFRRWGAVEGILIEFFASEVVVESLRAHWYTLGLANAER
jgi:hypothetical protein